MVEVNHCERWEIVPVQAGYHTIAQRSDAHLHHTPAHLHHRQRVPGNPRSQGWLYLPPYDSLRNYVVVVDANASESVDEIVDVGAVVA